MVVRGTRASLARARMIRSARRNRSSKILSGSSSRNTSSRLNSSSRTQSTSNTTQTKKIAMYEKVQKATDELQKVAKSLVELGKTGTVENTDKTDTEKTSDAQTNGKTQEEQKRKMITAVKDLVEHYNIIYEKLDEIGGSVNTVFTSQLKKLMMNCEDDLKKTGVTLNKDGTLSITAKTLENTELSTLKEVYGKSSGLVGKLSEKCESIESNASSTIDVMNRMYGTQTYNKYGYGNSYYGNTGSWYSALG